MQLSAYGGCTKVKSSVIKKVPKKMKQIFTKFTILFLLPFVTLSEDYYQLLGIKKNAENRDIRKAFKKLALKYHPDKNSEDDAHEKFLKINKAYEVNAFRMYKY